MVVLRLKRMGRAHKPFYRLGAMDKRSPRDGRVIEQLGWYDPTAPDERQHEIKLDRVRYWLSVGAQPSRTVNDLLRRLGCDAKPGTPFDASEAASAPASAEAGSADAAPAEDSAPAAE